jgi:phytoene dehydrogenase-like protein
MPGLNALIVGREILTPEDLERGWGMSGGHIFHGEPAIDQSWIARPLLGWSQYRTPVTGLYLASAGAHPGGGLTGLPGLLAAQAVESARR